MVTSISIGKGTLDNIVSGFTTMGFTITTVSASEVKATWDNDTDGNLYFRVYLNGSTPTIQLYKSNNTLIHGGTTTSTTVDYIMTYEQINDSIVFGFVVSTSVGRLLQYGIIEPEEAGRSWLYCMPYSQNASTARQSIIDGKTEIKTEYGTTSLLPATGGAVQACKYYDGLNFRNSVLITTICQNIPGLKNHIDTTTGNNFLEATIGDNNYLIINPCGTENTNKIAIKRPSSST